MAKMIRLFDHFKTNFQIYSNIFFALEFKIDWIQKKKKKADQHQFVIFWSFRKFEALINIFVFYHFDKKSAMTTEKLMFLKKISNFGQISEHFKYI